ncbi:MAG: VTT domain-containing protein [Thiotrichaceae bacterium]|nr:VTT domain-containing protein [Thiotrichaceae bacterium]
MKELIKVMLTLALVFASTFILIKATGILTLEDIQLALEQAQQIHPGYLALVVIGLLFVDLFIAIPTMTVTIMAGFFLGWPMAAAATISGFLLAGTIGYAISRRYGWRLLNRIYQDREKLDEMHRTFSTYGPVMLIICRAMPILPEVSCCMAGATRMSLPKFLTMYALGTIPYALIITYAGSISSLDNPKPAILAAIGISLTLWTGWYLLGRHARQQKLRRP